METLISIVREKLMYKFFLFLIVCITPALLAEQAEEVIYTCDSSMKFAVGDIMTLPADIQPYIRYLSLHNEPKEKRRKVATLVSFTMNSLSKRGKSYIPVFVGASNETLIRVNLKDYDIDPKEWEELGKNGSGPKPFPEPYFHAFATTVESVPTVRKTRQVPYNVLNNRGQLIQQFRTEFYDEQPSTTNRKKELIAAPWLDANTVNFLCNASRSSFPMYRADWFIVYSTIEPAYHKLLGLGETEKDFEKVIFADETLAKKAKSQDKAVVVKSSVARNNRTLNRSPTFIRNGYIWRSHDSLKSIDDKNYVQNFLDEKFDAKEIIANLPNGLQTYFVTDADGKRVDKADNEIATDHMAADRIVRTGRSCIYCHAPGINPIQDEIRTLNRRLQNREEIRLLVTDEKDYYRIEELFGTNLDKQIIRDQQTYADAVGEATGMGPQQIATMYFDLWEGYTESLMSKQDVARELGMNMHDFEKYCRMSNDNLFLGLINQPARPVRRDQFERSYQDFVILSLRAKIKQ